MKILVTGGNGYIGSHTCVELLESGYEVVVLDNFSNSKRENLEKIKQITNKDFAFYEGDMIDRSVLDKIFTEHKIDAVIDFAAYKAVGESVQKPIEYYINNVSTVLELLKAMKDYNVKKLVFSSSATVYGDPKVIPITEDCEIGGTTNPYGTSKLFVEQILKDLYKSDNTFDIAILRYFNPIGAHESGLIGEEPNGIPANLLPYVSKVASGKLECLSVFGNDYDTKDGTGVRDYIHVVDLAKGHINALEKLNKEGQGLFIYNLGTGTGYSVLDIVNTFEKVNNVKVNYQIVDRRSGDIATCYSDPTKAEQELGFKAERTLEDMCRDLWNYETHNNNKEKEYVYTMNLVVANFIAILIMVIFFVITPLINKNLSYDFKIFELVLLYVTYFIWMGLHEILHGIGYRIGGAKGENVVYGVYLEKSILCTLCKQEIPKRAILISLCLPFLVIGVITYIIGMLINNVPLILLSILNLGGASMDIAMFIYILTKDKEIRYSESNNPTEFVLISKEDLTKKKSLAFKTVDIRDYDPKHFEFERTSKITISKTSKQILIITVIIIFILLSLYYIF